MATSIPKISSRFFCIVNRKEKILAAVISSYLNTAGKYLPLFEFPEVEAPKPESDEIPFDENYIMATRADEFGIRTFNALQRLRGCEYLIVAGLTEEQKSFLYYLAKYNVIEINSLSDVKDYLGPISGKKEFYNCRPEDVCYGLYHACLGNLMLNIDKDVPALKAKLEYKKAGLILIEEDEYLSPILAVNYAVSIGAEIIVTTPPNANIFEVKILIEQWKTQRDPLALKEISALLYSKVEGIEFTKYTYATFFTFCAPYSIILKNEIAFTYVNTQFRPDFFIFNNLYIYGMEQIHSAIVFSPLEFGTDEETGFVINKLDQNQIFVKQLIGKTATVYNIDNHVREYPYEILHICSHGGEVPGYPVSLDFLDKDGGKHTIEYDDVVSFAPTKGEKIIAVTHKYIFRKLDGLKWKSKELKDLNYPHSLYTSMMDTIHKNKLKYGNKIPSVEGSCSIKCSDFVYQGMFNAIAGHTLNPFIFNNTCWSWVGISDAFLSVGCTGYIGTLWAVDNKVAVAFAESFYDSVFNETISESFHRSMQKTKGTDSEDIYVFWGLHFSFLQKGDSVEKTRMAIASNLLDSFYHWHDKLKEVGDAKTKQQIDGLFNWTHYQLFEHFFKEALRLIRPPIK